MKYTLDVTIEKLLHSLQELIIFRRKFESENAENETTELAILGDIIVDLAEGIGHYLSHPDPKHFAREISECRFTSDIAKIFNKYGFNQFLCPPYFSNNDIEKLSLK